MPGGSAGRHECDCSDKNEVCARTRARILAIAPPSALKLFFPSRQSPTRLPARGATAKTLRQVRLQNC